VNLDTAGSVIDMMGQSALRRAQAALNLVQPVDIRENYSLARLFNYLLTEGAGDYCFEAHCDDEYGRAGFKKQQRNSAFVPPWAIARYLDQTGMRTLQGYQTTVTGSGAELTETTFLANQFIDALRTRNILLQLGATWVRGLVGDVEIPRMDSASTAYWLTTIGSSPVLSGVITESEGTFDSTPITAAPCQLGGLSNVSRKLLQQSELANYIIANDLIRVLGAAAEVSAFAGAGSGGTPTGIVNVSGVNAVSGASFETTTAINAVQDVASANAIISRRSLGWAATPAVAGLLMGRSMSTTGWPPIWQGSLDTGEIYGLPALSSNNVPAGTAIFGDWSQVMFLSWGANMPIEIEINPYQFFATGDVGYRAMMSINIVVRHPASFSVVSSIT
jgi:HK97 family phage major capsid protein